MDNLQVALNDYVKVLLKQQALREVYKEEISKWEHTQNKIRNYLLSATGVSDIPSQVKHDDPFLAWKLGAKTDLDLLETIKAIRDVAIPAIEKEMEEKLTPLKEARDELEKYALALLEQRGATNFSATGVGRIEKRIATKYNIADKSLFTKWAMDNHCESELSITLRPNSKFMAQVVEENGELPPGVSSFAEYKAVFVKA